jgi:hypothetical protein
LRAGTLSDDKVIAQLNHTFVSGWTNIKGKRPYAGSSNTHLPDYAAKNINACSGHHNIQMFFLTKDGRVLHCLPGYWAAEDFLKQVQFAVLLARVYYSKDLSSAEKNEKFLDMHLQKALSHPYALVRGSKLQGFDVDHVKKKEDSDFVRDEGFVGGIKHADQVVHERMAERPFVPFEKFDTAKFIDMGIKQFKYDYGVPGKEDPYSRGAARPKADKKAAPEK